MRLRFCFIILPLIATVSGLVAYPSFAHDTAEKYAHYQLRPIDSALQQSDGAAVAEYQLFGDVVIRYGGVFSTNACFEIADVGGSLSFDNPEPAIDIDVDETLSLENLTGAVLQSAAPTEVYRFRGHTIDGASMNVFAAMNGAWVYLRGSSEPPPGSADFVTYNFHALGRSRPFADFNDDGVVDGADYVMIRKFPDSAVYPGATYDDWKEQFGERMLDVNAMDALISAAAGSSVAAASVPEPGTVGLAIIAGIVLASPRRR
jgi:hypothetical protein